MRISTKNKLNLRDISYNPMTNGYNDEDGHAYVSYEQARLFRWKCDKCNTMFSSYKLVKSHKSEYHSY